MANEDLMIQLSLLEQRSEEVRQQIETVEEQAKEMDALKSSLEALDKNKNGEVLANLGRGIFVKTQVGDDQVFLNVGSKTFIRKSFKDAAEIVEKQVSELGEIKHHLMHSLEDINLNLQSLVEEARESRNIS